MTCFAPILRVTCQEGISMRSRGLRSSPDRIAGVLAIVLATGTAAGAYSRISRVPAFDTETWSVPVPYGRSRIVVQGDGDTNLDCYVHDTRGRLLGDDDDTTDHCVVGITRRKREYVRVKVINLGSVYNRYELRVE
jgi:hypothetical protein